MRASRLFAIVALSLVPAVAAGQSGAGPQGQPAGAGQKPGTPTAPAAPSNPDVPPAEEAAGWVGFIDFGVRGTSLDGDSARFERYRDLGDGLFLETAQLEGEANGWLWDFNGQHVGRRDQRLVGAGVLPGRFSGRFMWDQIPMILSRTTRTLFAGVGSPTLSIDDSIQAQVQRGGAAALNPLFDQFSREFDTKTRRYIGEGAVEYFASDALTFRTTFRRTDRDGTIPFGGSFGHGSLVEVPAPTEHTLTDFDASAEYVRDPWLFRGGYTGSWFHNDITSLVFDSPYRLDDIRTASSAGRLALPPSNSQISVNGMASLKLPYRSRASAYASIGVLKDAGDPLIPQTINSANTTQPLERSLVEGEAGISSINLTFVSRPRRYADINVRYRAYEYDNRTPEFALFQRVAYDNAPSNLDPPVHTEPYSVSRGTFDADFRFVHGGRTSAGVGYTHVGEDRTHRIFESTTDHVLRVTFDTLTRGWLSLRTKYEHAQRRGEGIEQGETLLASIGEQPKLRHFDVANRDRDRVTVIGTLTPVDFLVTSLTFAAGKDDYIESIFGLRDNTHRVYGIGADYLATEMFTFGVSYSYEDYEALQRSRQAGAPTGPTASEFFDPSRNWAADTADRTHTVILNADVTGIAEKVDARVTYDFSKARARYTYITGPVANRTLPEEVIVPSTLPTPTELPPTFSQFHRATVDVSYRLTNRVSVGVSYWHDQYDVRDFTLDIDANPELVRGQALLMGYLYRPYTADTGWVRLLYRW